MDIMQWKLIELVNSWEITDIVDIQQSKDGSVWVNCSWGDISTPGTLTLV